MGSTPRPMLRALGAKESTVSTMSFQHSMPVSCRGAERDDYMLGDADFSGEAVDGGALPVRIPALRPAIAQ